MPAFSETLLEGSNGNIIYLSLMCTSDSDGKTPVTQVSKDGNFYLWVNFAGNPSGSFETIDEETSIRGIWAYDLLIGYNNEKMSLIENVSQLACDVCNPTYADGIVYAGYASQGGIYKFDDATEKNVIYPSGSLFRLTVTASADLTAEDLKSITILKEYENIRTNIMDGEEKLFTIVQTPTITDEKVTTDVVFNVTPADAQVTLGDVTITAVDGVATFEDVAFGEKEYTVSA
ncbi:MAG: hypothetical protein IJC89_01520, partial [Clostridia bacterium]|nr:hypothetical protein [Clostridia bacterium]